MSVKKRFLVIVILLTLFLGVVGCGKEKEKTKVVPNKSETSNPENQSEENTSEDNTSEAYDYELYTDDKKMVFLDGNKYSLYYYSGTKITAYHAYIDYETEEAANEALANYTKPKNVDKAYTKGRYLVLEYNKSEYKDLTIYKLRNMYGDSEQLQDK